MVEIHSDGATCNVKIDGQEIKRVRGFTLTQSAEELPKLTLDIADLDIYFNGSKFAPTLPDAYKNYYVSKIDLLNCANKELNLF